MGSILDLNFVFEKDSETFNGSPRYSYRGPLYNFVKKQRGGNNTKIYNLLMVNVIFYFLKYQEENLNLKEF